MKKVPKTKDYTICKLCNQPMAPGAGCTVDTVTCNDKDYKRIPVGDEHDFDPNMGEGDVCHDCNAGVGQNHHLGCDAEQCPNCLEQLISCDCDIR